MRQFLLLCLSVTTLCAQELIPYEVNGDPDNTINIVIVAEGYTAADKSALNVHIAQFADEIFSDPVLANYRSYHNVYGFFVESNESGSDDPLAGVYRDTYFDSKYNTSNIDRLLTANSTLATQMVNDLFPQQDIIMMSVNYNKYGGSGGAIAVSAYSAPGIAAHEIGHSFPGLADEYDYTAGYTARERVNSTAMTSYNQIRWNYWIHPATPLPTPETLAYADTVGLFEGSQYNATGWYRPQLNCRMKSNGVDLCAICAEAWVLRIHEIISPMQSSTHANGAVVDLAVDSLTLTPRQPINQSVIVEWSRNDSIIFVGPTLPPEKIGVNEPIIGVVRDTTTMVREDPSALLTDSLSFTVTGVTVTPTTSRPEMLLQQSVLYSAHRLTLLGFAEKSLNISLYSVNGKKLFSGRVAVADGRAQINLPERYRGIVLLKVRGTSTDLIKRLVF